MNQKIIEKSTQSQNAFTGPRFLIGIRIENVVYIKKIKNKLLFKNLTLAPIDIDLINFKLLDNKEKKYLSYYHKYIYQKVSNFLNKEEKIWLKNLI